MSRTTDALVVEKAGAPFRLDKIQLSSIGPDEALVEIQATGVCHTDLSCAAGLIPSGFPGVYGHEGGGTVLEVGSNVPSSIAQAGDKVLLSFFHCQTCDMCKSDHPAYCPSFALNFSGKRPDNTSAMSTSNGEPLHSSFFGQSSFARHALVHKTSIVKVPKETNIELFAPLGCGLQTGAGAVLNTLNVKEGSTLAVFGVGSVGMSAVMAGKLRKAKKIIAIDLQQSRLDLAKKLGATDTILGDDEELVQKVQKLCEPGNGVNFAVDCSGVPVVVEKMVECLGTRGRAATVGAPSPGKKASIDIWNQLVMGREYVGCCEGDCVPSQVSCPPIFVSLFFFWP